MLKRILLLCLFAVQITLSWSQGTMTSPQILSAGRKIMDYEPYKLVFSDDFNGTTLDRTKWRTYQAWYGMPGGDNDNWENSRRLFERYSIIRDENVVVSGGTCSLLLFKKANNWKCDACPETKRIYRNGTVGIIETYFQDPITGQDVSWSTGKFETRVKWPTYRKTFGALWLYHANVGGIEEANEIDIAEAYGDPFMPGGVDRWNNRRTQFTTHQYYPFKASLGSFRFPSQTWGDYLRGRYFKQGDFHTYTCEWDSNRVSMYIDGNFFMSVHKWYQDKSIRRKLFGWRTIRIAAPDVIPSTDLYHVYWGFPWQYPTHTELKIWNGWGEDPGLVPNENELLPNSQVVIDYVKVWQRIPQGGHQNLCNQNVPSIIGPSIIPSTGGTIFSVDFPITGSTWSASGLGAYISSSDHISCVLNKSSGSSKKTTVLGYTYNKSGCPPQTISRKIDFGEPAKPPVFVVDVNYNNAYRYLQLAATGNKPNSPTTYEWTINYGSQRTYHAFGAHISTPIFSNAEPELVSWTLTVANAVGSSTFTGSKTSNIYFTNQDSTLTEESDTASFYLNALITDSVAYENVVDTQVLMRFFTDPNDSIGINSTIEQIRFEQLSPYFIYDSLMGVDTNSQNLYRLSQTPIEAVTKIYPNPTTSILNIALGTNYILEEPKHVTITNMSGSTVLKTEFPINLRKSTIDVEHLSSGTYIIEISQKGYLQKAKFVKQ